MAHSITVRLNKDAREFQTGDSIGFNIRAGVQYYDRQSKQKEWTNYSAIIFAKPGAQADFYRSVLVVGGVVEVTGDNIKVDVYNGQNGQSITLELLNARLGFAQGAEQGNQSQGRPVQARNQPQHSGQSTAQANDEPTMEWNTDIPF